MHRRYIVEIEGELVERKGVCSLNSYAHNLGFEKSCQLGRWSPMRDGGQRSINLSVPMTRTVEMARPLAAIRPRTKRQGLGAEQSSSFLSQA